MKSDADDADVVSSIDLDKPKAGWFNKEAPAKPAQPAQSIFEKYLISHGASSTEIKRINETLKELQKRAGLNKVDKQTDQIALLREIE